MAKGFHVIKFSMLDFDENWKRTLLGAPIAHVLYTAKNPRAKLAVVLEAPTGTLTTYRYEIEPDAEVVVVDQVVHIPDRCIRQDDRNTVRCDQG